jgi:hypothetical protein
MAHSLEASGSVVASEPPLACMLPSRQARQLTMLETTLQELKSGEDNLLQALTAVQDALKAETRAHDVDIATLDDFMHRNRILEEQLAAARRQGFAPDATAGSSSGELVASVTSADGESRTHHDGSGLRSVLKLSGEKPVTGSTGVLGLQRYCPETDSYRFSPFHTCICMHVCMHVCMFRMKIYCVQSRLYLEKLLIYMYAWIHA